MTIEKPIREMDDEELRTTELDFVLRDRDALAPLAVLKWIELAMSEGVSKSKTAAACRHLAAMLEKQGRLGSKVPD